VSQGLASLDLFPGTLPSKMVSDFGVMAINARTGSVVGWLCIAYMVSLLGAVALILVYSLMEMLI